jgi:hypothetical protein
MTRIIRSGPPDTVAAMEYFSSDVGHAINMLRKEK